MASTIVVHVKENETIDKALKRFKKKYERVGIVKELRSRQAFEKKSVAKRNQRLRAAYRQQFLNQQEA